MNAKIYKVGNDSAIDVDFIYNRFDLWLPTVQFDTWCYESEEEDKMLFQIGVVNSTAHLGIWLLDMDASVLESIITRLFCEYTNVNVIEYSFSFTPYGEHLAHNSYRIVLPDKIEEIDLRISSKARYNMRRQLRLFEEEYGKIEFRRSDARSPDVEKVWEAYFALKNDSHGTVYNLSVSDYCNKYHVTDIYWLQVGKNEIAAVILSCEQCEIVYIENLSYNAIFSKYSPGQLLYNWYLKELVRKRKKEIFLGGGNYEYKERYNSDKQTVYDGKIYRNNLIKKKMELQQKFSKMRWYKMLSAVKTKFFH